MVEYSSYDFLYILEEKSIGCEKSVEQQGEGDSLNLADTFRSLTIDIRSSKFDYEKSIEAKERLEKSQEKQVEVNAFILQILCDLQKHVQLGTSHGDKQEENINGEYESWSKKRYMMDRDDTIKSGRLLSTPDQRATTHGYYSSSTSSRHHRLHCQHHYRNSEKEYFPEEFKRPKPLNFDGEMNISKYVEAWLLRMRKKSRLHVMQPTQNFYYDLFSEVE